MLTSREIFVIILFISIGTFFFLSFILRRVMKAGKLRVGLTWGGTVILTPLIYFGLRAVFLSVFFYQPSEPFDREAWFADKSKRYEMMDDIVENEILKDKNEQQVIELIGLPDSKTATTNIWNYDLGAFPSGFGIQFNKLSVKFDNDRVIKVEKHEFVD